MKKNYLSVLLLFLTLGIFAQVPMHYNLNTASGSNTYPFGTTVGRKVQWRILPNSLVNPTPVGPGNNITAVYFLTSNANTGTYPNITISLKQGVTQFTGGGLFETGMTNVYTGNNVTLTGITNGWMQVILQTPFLYDPNQALLIEVEQNSTSGAGPYVNQSNPGGGLGPGRQYGNFGSATYTGTDLNVIHFGVDVLSATPCSVQPGPNAVVTPTNLICPNASALLTLANTYSFGGITYSWQSSTVSPVGPFTAVNGATNTVFSAPSLTTDTWYNVVITCTNAVGTTTASVGQVSIAATTTASVPYYESFEGIGQANKLPNCSWAISNQPTCQTYTSSNTLGRMPKSGTNFASFYYSPAGNNYFYTNGIYLQAGITYSAGLWYQTEYYGYNNWTDLSILYGTSQSPTGLVPIASTNGAAVSNVYKPLSNTFTVPASGLYYIAVKGSGTTSGAQYLTWDDLSITIPCNENSPNLPPLTMITNTNSVCGGDPVNLTASGADTYTWSTGSNASAIVETPTSDMVYTVIGTNALTGCTASTMTTIYVLPSPTVIAVSNKQNICSGSCTSLLALGSSNNQYAWSNGAFGANVSVCPTVSTTYTVIATGQNGCVSTANAVLNVLGLPTISASSSRPNTMCLNEVAVLTASGTATSYLWVSNISGLLLSGSSVNVSPSSTAIYTVTGTDNNGCEQSTTLVQTVDMCSGILERAGLNTMNVYPNPNGGEFVIHSQNTLQKAVEVIDINGKVVASLSSDAESVSIDIKNFASGIYYVKVQSNNSVEVIKVVKE